MARLPGAPSAPPPHNSPYIADNHPIDQRSPVPAVQDPYIGQLQPQPAPYPPQPVPNFPPPPPPPYVHEQYHQPPASPFPPPKAAPYSQPPDANYFQPPPPTQGVPFPPPPPVVYSTTATGQTVLHPASSLPVHAAADGGAQPVYVNTPVVQHGLIGFGTEPWTTELFDCLDDPTNAFITAFVPCVTFGQIAEIVDHGQSTCVTAGVIYGLMAPFVGIPSIYSSSYRTKLRSKYGLMEAPAPDWLTHFLCEWCALCQAFRELKNRGIDPAIGWHANMMIQAQHQQQQQVAMTPPLRQTMGA